MPEDFVIKKGHCVRMVVVMNHTRLGTRLFRLRTLHNDSTAEIA